MSPAAEVAVRALAAVGITSLYQSRKLPGGDGQRHLLSNFSAAKLEDAREVLLPLGWLWDAYGDLFFLDEPT